MSDNPASEIVGEQTPAQVTPRSSSAMLLRICTLLFLIAVIGAECLLASLLLPIGSESSSAAASTTHPEPKSGHPEKEKKDKKDKQTGHSKEAHAKDSHPKDSHARDDAFADASDQVEVDLEEYNITAHMVASNTTMRIEFHLYGVIALSNKEEFERLVKANQHRLRDQVLAIVRGAQPRDLADAGLGLIKRQILEKTNALLGKPLLRAVIVSEFSYMEQ